MIPSSFARIVFLPPPIRLPLIRNSLSSSAKPNPLKYHLLKRFIPPPIRAALSGALAETLVHLVLYPLDTCKTHRQYSSRKPNLLAPFAGAPIGLVGAALDAAVFTLVYHILQRLTRNLPKAPASLFSAAISSLVSTAVDSPFTLARDRIRLGRASSWRDAWREAGSTNWRGLYVGARESIIRDVPFEAMEYGTYEGLKKAFARVKTVTAVDMVALGMVTGAVTGAVMSPLDLVVTRCIGDPGRYKGVLSTIGKVVGEGGVVGVFAGAKQKILREMASSALFFCVYDSLRGEE